MVFQTFVKDSATRAPVVLAIVSGNDLNNGNNFVRGTDGRGYSDIDMKDSPIGNDVALTVQHPKYGNFIGYYKITEDNQSITVELNALFKRPSKEIVRTFRGLFGGLVVPELQYSINNTKILFTPAYVVESPLVRQICRSRYIDAGLTHFPINLYNTTPIYHNFYPDWDDNYINMYLEELLSSGLIPVGSMFADNVKVVKPVVDPKLVPAGFTGWENPWPIIRPKQDLDNLFYVARQYFGPNCLIYWHNPNGQGAPYYNAVDWGYPPGTELNAIVWNYIVNQSGCQGLLFQSKGWIDPNDPNSGPQASIARLLDFVPRFKHGINGWPLCDLVDMEETIYYMTTMAQPVSQGLAWARQIRNSVPELNGYCNG